MTREETRRWWYKHLEDQDLRKLYRKMKRSLDGLVLDGLNTITVMQMYENGLSELKAIEGELKERGSFIDD
ncbi:MAG: hypothetical protein L0Y56_03920 [Nitrospira sp.]|nr:hypothetical protein [Nitrospira sp.]